MSTVDELEKFARQRRIAKRLNNQGESLDERVVYKAALIVASNALGIEDGKLLLDMLGLIEPQEGNEPQNRKALAKEESKKRIAEREEAKRLREEKERLRLERRQNRTGFILPDPTPEELGDDPDEEKVC